MVGICCNLSRYPTIQIQHRRVNSFRCCAVSNKRGEKSKASLPTPQLLKTAVVGLTELLRLFPVKDRLDTINYDQENDVSLSSIDDVLNILESDYENEYFVTGTFTWAIYSEDCLFEDPTIKFRGTELYARNLKLLVPFFDHPSIVLQNIEKETNAETSFVLATWKLRTYLRLPWRPLISINGNTVYDLDDNFKIVRHTESWDVSAVEAIGQIFTPSIKRSNGVFHPDPHAHVLSPNERRPDNGSDIISSPEREVTLQIFENYISQKGRGEL